MADCSLDEYISKRGIRVGQKKGLVGNGGALALTQGIRSAAPGLTTTRLFSKGHVESTVPPQLMDVQVGNSNTSFDARAKIAAKAQSTNSVVDARQKLNQKISVPDARQKILSKNQTHVVNQQQAVWQGNVPNQSFNNVQQQILQPAQTVRPPQKQFKLQPVVFNSQDQKTVQSNNRTTVMHTNPNARINSASNQTQLNQAQSSRGGSISSRLQGRLGLIGGQGQAGVINRQASQTADIRKTDIGHQVQQFNAKFQQRQPLLVPPQSFNQQSQRMVNQPTNQIVRMQLPAANQYPQQYMQQQKFTPQQRQSGILQQQLAKQPLPFMQQQQKFMPQQQSYILQQQQQLQQSHMMQQPQQLLYDEPAVESGLDDSMYEDDVNLCNNGALGGSGFVTMHGDSIQKVIGGSVQTQQHLSNTNIQGRQAIKRTSYDLDMQQQYQQGQQQGFRTSHGSRPPVKVVRRDEGNGGQQQSQVTEFSSPLQGVCVTIENLLPSVTLDDIVELFGAVGAVKRARFIRPGTAEIAFVEESAAVKAVKRYHQRELDGEPMQVIIRSKTSGQQTVKRPTVSDQSAARSSTGQPLRLGPAGDVNAMELDPDVLHRALFKTASSSSDSTRATRPVNFTVHM